MTAIEAATLEVIEEAISLVTLGRAEAWFQVVHKDNNKSDNSSFKINKKDHDQGEVLVNEDVEDKVLQASQVHSQFLRLKLQLEIIVQVFSMSSMEPVRVERLV